MFMDKQIKISKLDSAKRQLETLIRLYFQNGDPVSIHTLCSAAYTVIKDINEKRGGSPMLVLGILKVMVKPDKEREVRQLLKQAENFFKHADRDHDETLDFNPKQTDILILDACSKYFDLTGEWPPLFKIYQAWYIVNNNDQFNLPEDFDSMVSTVGIPLISLGKQDFFNKMLPIVMRY